MHQSTHSRFYEVKSLSSLGADVHLIRSARRRTVAIQVSHNTITLRVPAYLPERIIEAMVVKKIGWIKFKLKDHQHHEPLQRRLLANDTLPFLDDVLTLSFNDQYQRCTLIDQRLTLPSSSQADLGEKHKLLKHWYVEQANQYLTERTQSLASIVGVQPSEVKVRSYKARWGSCSSNGIISYNWLIMMAPTTAVDYVIIHELCHMHELNHSPAYWQWVARFMPNYKEHQRWFKENTHQITLV